MSDYLKCVECGETDGLELCSESDCEHDVCPRCMVRCKGCGLGFCAQHALRMLDVEWFCDSCPALSDDEAEAQFWRDHPQFKRQSALDDLTRAEMQDGLYDRVPIRPEAA